MYLVHLRLRSAGRRELPGEAAGWVRAAARTADGVEHATLHPHALPYPVMGVYVLAERIEQAEDQAARACRRALADRPELQGWQLVDAQAPLIAPFFT